MKLKMNRLCMSAVAAAALLVAACGGEEAPGPDSTTPTTPTSAALAALEVTSAKATIEAKADQTTTVTVTAIDANRRALADVPVTLSSNSGVLSGASETTDSNGNLTATLGLGADRGNRDILITATSGTIVSTATVQVAGTTLTLSASPPTAQTATTPVEISASVVDAAKVPLGGVVVSFVTTGGTLSSAVATTDAAGIAKVTLTGVTADVSVTAGGANVGGKVDVKAGSTTLPPLSPAGVLVKDLTVQVNPSVVGPNAGGATTNFSQLDVRVTGDAGTALGIPVGSAPVRIRIASTPAFGTLSVDTTTSPVLTNGSGLASARFIAGPSTTGTDQIVVCASVDGVATLPGGGQAPCGANEKSAKLTISQQPLFIRISTNNEIQKINNNLDYEKLFSIYVTNAAGQGVAGAPVSVRLLPRFYWKGSMAYLNGRWTPSPAPVQCGNEDLNFNGVLDTGDNNENMDGFLWPGQSAAFTLDNNGVTDSAGFVNLRVRHGQRFYFWAEYQIEARAATAGSERLTTFDYRLSAAEADVTATASPGFRLSPFGQGIACTDPN